MNATVWARCWTEQKARKEERGGAGRQNLKTSQQHTLQPKATLHCTSENDTQVNRSHSPLQPPVQNCTQLEASQHKTDTHRMVQQVKHTMEAEKAGSLRRKMGQKNQYYYIGLVILIRNLIIILSYRLGQYEDDKLSGAEQRRLRGNGFLIMKLKNRILCSRYISAQVETIYQDCFPNGNKFEKCFSVF